ncbi:FAD-dependent oxidoreductase [Cellulomonas sp. ATA003]|uniref:FAD-dependent oxidoreductase n=1 Tax=Cellulomonas sp. ATA003 TaxID=3073064 RepID=UPI002872E9E4|nr:FAD-dependent oxidoreductase [Cellulomonas sp. ATA003]WNB85474.1 FAD-dependent oxidoreductase [Cellulomonas sp. ATA003]
MTDRVDVDVAVVGGGAMGSAAAWQLAGRGLDVVLLERFAPGHVHGASHGASRLFRHSYPEPDYLDLAEEARRLWRELEDVARTELLTITGGVTHGPRIDPHLADALSARGVPFAWLAPDEAAERWPGLRFDGPVLHEPHSTGRLHADRAVAALQRAAGRSGATVRHEAPVRRLEIALSGDAVRVVTDGGSVVARRVVVTVGAWSAALLQGVAGFPADAGAWPLVVTQEQPAHFALRDGAPALADWPGFVHAVAPGTWPSVTYGLATPGEGIKVGFHGTGPVTDPDRRTFAPEPAQLEQLRSYVARWVPGADPDVLDPISCTYTTTPDSDFVLDRRGPVVVGAGFSGHGFKFATAIGRVLADLADPRTPSSGTARGAGERFALARLVTGASSRATAPSRAR